MTIKQVFNTSAELDYPTVLPTLDLDFVNSKTLDPRITFTRGSGGSYVDVNGLIKYAGVNEPRFDHDPITSESLGLLTELTRTNILTYSQNFDDVSWSKNFDETLATIIFSNSIIAPDGSLTGTKLVESENIFQHYIFKNRSGSNEIVTLSIFCKEAERTKVALQLSNFFNDAATVIFNLVNGQIESVLGSSIDYTNISAGTIPYPNGWYRCYLTAQKEAINLINNPTISIVNENNNLIYDGDGFSGIYIWGAQLEIAEAVTDISPTSYIPTQNSTRTRASDFARVIGNEFSKFYNSNNSGTIFVSAKEYSGRNSSPFWFNAGSNNRGIAYRRLGTNVSFDYRGDVSRNVAVVGGIPINKTNKVAISFNTEQSNASANGSIVESSFSSPINVTINQLRIGFSQIGGTTPFYWYGHVQKLSYWNRLLSNSQLQALTN
jgi:hypothetical protein